MSNSETGYNTPKKVRFRDDVFLHVSEETEHDIIVYAWVKIDDSEDTYPIEFPIPKSVIETYE